MGYTSGFVITSGQDVARFFYDLLGPEYKIVSKETVEIMKQFSQLDMGWSAGLLEYGGGLMLRNESPH